MRIVLIYSVLLLLGLIGSQWLPLALGDGYGPFGEAVRLCTMFGLCFIMIRVGYEFDIDKSNLKQYGWDYFVAFTAAAIPWVLVSVYFIFVLLPAGAWTSLDAWKETLLAGRFASPTSAGVLFSMLAAAGLASTWLFRKARVLAIFDDLDTVLLMIPLKMLMVGLAWQLGAIVVVIVAMLAAAYIWLHRVRLPATWPWVLAYSAVITIVCEVVYLTSKIVDDSVPIHIEVLLPAFVLGCMLAYPRAATSEDAGHAAHALISTPREKGVANIVAAAFMVFVGLSMPAIGGGSAAEADPAEPSLAAPGSAAAGAGAAAGPDPEAWPEAADRIATHQAPAPALARLPAMASAEAADLPVNANADADADSYTASQDSLGWGAIAWHVFWITILSNLGKMFPAFCYRREAHWRERLACAVGMWPRGEVGAGVLIISLGYGIGGPIVTVSMLSLALNLLLTGVFIVIATRLTRGLPGYSSEDPGPTAIAA